MKNLLDENIITIEDVKDVLTQHFPDHKIQQSWFNKNVLLVQDGVIMATVTLKKNKTKVSGGLNSRNMVLIIIIVLVGFFFRILGLAIMFGLIYFLYRNHIQAFANEVRKILRNKL